jgi:hypothetical protein
VQMNFLRSHGCDEMQGYLFARPLSVEDCTRALVEKRRMNFTTPRVVAPRARGLFRHASEHIHEPTTVSEETELAVIELEWLRRCNAISCIAPAAVVAALERAGLAKPDDVGRLRVTDKGRDYLSSYNSEIKKRRRK